MNQKGFSTILGLCLLMVIALLVMGIQTAERNHAYESAADFQAEFDLQNAAESAVIEAAEKVLSDPSNLQFPEKYSYNRKDAQFLFPNTTKSSDSLGSITVEVWGERVELYPLKVDYDTDDENSEDATKYIAKNDTDSGRVSGEAYFFVSRASATSKYTGEKIFRRATAYVKVGETAIHLMEVPMSSYVFDSEVNKSNVHS